MNGAKMGLLLFVLYIILNLYGLAFVVKLKAERYLQKSGINYTIVRPGGITKDPPKGNIVIEAEDTLYKGFISREQLGEAVVEALLHPEANNKVLEIVARHDAPKRSFQQLFSTKKHR